MSTVLAWALAKGETPRQQILPVGPLRIDAFNGAVAGEMPHLSIDVSPVRLDEKHLRAHEFELARGRHRALVIAKSKSEITLVGPFKTGKNEGPCRTFPFSAESDLEDALEDFLERFLEDATAP